MTSGGGWRDLDMVGVSSLEIRPRMPFPKQTTRSLVRHAHIRIGDASCARSQTRSRVALARRAMHAEVRRQKENSDVDSCNQLLDRPLVYLSCVSCVV